MNEFSTCYASKRVLITGSGGYLASNLVELLKNTECTILRLSRNTTRLRPLEGVARIINVSGDISLRTTWEQALEEVEFVFHFAAQTSVYVANDDPSADLTANVLPMLHLLEICREKGWQPVVLFAGTVTEMGIPAFLPVNETPSDNPVTVYDLHKWMAERYLKHYAQQGFVRGATLRLANVYGPGPKGSSPDRGVLNLMIRKAFTGEPITVYGRGDYIRDYIYVEDVVRAFLEAGQHIDQVNSQYFVIGSGHGYTVAQAMNLVAEQVALKTGIRVPVIHTDPPRPLLPIESRNFVADSTGFTRATGWQASCPLSVGIDRTIVSLLKSKNTLSEVG